MRSYKTSYNNYKLDTKLSMQSWHENLKETCTFLSSTSKYSKASRDFMTMWKRIENQACQGMTNSSCWSPLSHLTKVVWSKDVMHLTWVHVWWNHSPRIEVPHLMIVVKVLSIFVYSRLRSFRPRMRIIWFSRLWSFRSYFLLRGLYFGF